ncbi:MAG: alpha-L-fucosidase [Lentisphaeria bacterium]|nr:alpha-L-fucosidase [Lentisphaeria bacterium]
MTMADYGHGDLTWFQEARFGMFIHWGIYSMPGRHEWIQHYEEIPAEKYQIYFDLFDPDMFQPVEWAKAAKKAGMKYFVITTKHHDGFCLFDSKYTDFKATNTPAGRDLLREIVDAFRAEGIRVGFYYSLIDWHHPQCVVDNKIGPYRNLSEEEMAKMNEGRDQSLYAQYMRDQITELLTNYGKIDILWFDWSYPDKESDGMDATRGKGRVQWESEKLIRHVRSLQPDIIVDNRLDLPGSGDIVTPEQYTPDAEEKDENGKPIAWEGCQTFSGSWWYFRDELTWKSPEQCIKLLIDHVSRNGNLLMNVGPCSRGYIDDRAMNCLNAYGDWMKYNSRAIYGCGSAPAGMPVATDCRYTYNKKTNRLYVHLYSWPFAHLQLPELAGKVRYVQFLHDGSEVKWSENATKATMCAATAKNAVKVQLPVKKPDVLVPVLEVFLKD